MVVCRITMTGRHVGVFADRHSTSLAVPFHEMDTYRLGNGRIVEMWHIENCDGLGNEAGEHKSPDGLC